MFKLIKKIISPNNAATIMYQLIDTAKDIDGDYVVTIKMVNSPRGIFKLKAKQLLSTHRHIISKFTLEDTLTVLGLTTNDNQFLVEKNNSITYKYFSILCMIFISALLTANIASSKLISIFNYTMSGGVVVFPISYIIGDIITEVYGYKRARQLIWGSILCFVFCIAMIYLVINLPSSEYWHNQAAYTLVLGSVPRIIIASLISYCVGEFTNSYILARMKIFAVLNNKNNKWLLFMRILVSCIVGIVFDTSIFISIAYFGDMPLDSMIFLIMRQFIFKTSFEIILSPITLMIIKYIKNEECIDIVDIDTNFNPFLLDISYNTNNNISKIS